MSEDRFVSLPSGCRICYQVFGNPLHPAILLVSGHSSAMTQKTGGLIALLSPYDNPHFIIRFDHRDTGRSTSFTKPSDGASVYTLDAMADDIVGLIKHLELESIHLVGTSLGGPLAWQTASRLPQVNLEGQWLLAEAYEIPDDRDDDEGWIESYMRLDLALATRPPTEEEKAESRRDCEITYYREKESGTMWTKYNHSDASGVRWPRELLKHIRCPTVIIHAAKDQIFPLKHAEALRDDVDGATLVVLEDCGHEIPHRVRQRMADEILANVKKGE